MVGRFGPFRDYTTTLAPPVSQGDGGSRGPSTALEGTSTIELGWDGITPDQLRRWNEHNAPYRNLAGNPEIADRALKIVRASILHYEQSTLHLRRKWAELNTLIKGRSIRWGAWKDPDSVHSPKLYQALETLETRITDAILNTASGDGEWFVAHGREESDIEREAAVQGWMAWLLDKNKFDQRLSEMVRTMLVYSFCVVKTRWINHVDWHVRRERTMEPSPRGRLAKTERVEERKLLDSYAELDLVDPAWFFCDTRYTDPQKMQWIGDRCRMSFDEIADLGEQGEFENWEQLAEEEPHSLATLYGGTDDIGTTREDEDRWFNLHHLGSSKVFYVDRRWGRFDPYGTGRTREFELVVANGTHVIKVRENPHDDKFRPYALARACKYPFDFHSVGPLDHCLAQSIEIDTHRQLALDGSRMSVCPLVFTDQAANIGETLYGVEPGKVFDVAPGSIQFSDIKSPVDNMLKMESVLGNDIERTAGAPGFYMGGDAAGTNSATEFQGRQREANMRIRSYIRSMADMLREMLQQFCMLSGQYMLSERAVRVLGQKAGFLGDQTKISPDMLDSPVDFDFVVLGNLNVVGMEAGNMQLFLNGILPFAPPGQVNLAKLTERAGRMLLGSRAEGIVADVDDYRNLMSQDAELMMLMQGQPVRVRQGDDDMEHLEWIEGFKMSPMWGAIDDETRDLITQHEASHREALGAKRRQRMALDSYQAPFPMAAEAAYPGQGSATNMMRQNERATTGGGGPSGTPVGETSGPGRTQQLAKPGRSQPFTQTQNESMQLAG